MGAAAGAVTKVVARDQLAGYLGEDMLIRRAAEPPQR
jgi:hypothetical protein